jgi:hypothetical protein
MPPIILEVNTMSIYPSSSTAQELIITSNVQLDYPYSADLGNVEVTDIIDIIANAIDLEVYLPNSQLTNKGFSITFNNVGVNNFDIMLNDKSTLLTTVLIGSIITIYLFKNDTVNGNWRIIPFGGGVSAISNVNIVSSDSSILVDGGEISSPSGTADIKLPKIVSQLQNLIDKTTGIAVINLSTNPLEWNVVSLNEGDNITISNPNGKDGNPSIKLKNDISLTSVKSGDVIIENSLITNFTDGEILNIVSAGINSHLNLNSVLIDSAGNINDVNNLTISGSFKSPNVSKVWCRFNNVSGTITIASKDNVSTVEYNNINKQYTINFTNNLDNIDYAVFISCSNNNSTPPLQSRIGYDVVRQLDSVSIVLTDASGEVLEDIPEGVSIMILSAN